VSSDERAEDRLRRLAPQVLGALVRRYGHFDACEDAVQEALLAAARQWPESGVPVDPKAWLITVASRRLTDALRSEASRRRREEADAVRAGSDGGRAPAADVAGATGAGGDDTLTLFFLCCHPSLSPSSQLALTLRAVGGLTTAEIAAAFLVPETTMGQRISRAKQSIQAAGREFAMPPAAEVGERLAVVLHVLYLMFNEGYTASSGPELLRTDLTSEAIRLTREVHRLLPEEGEVAGLLALMLLTDARRVARTGPDGGLIPLAEQDRSRWDAALIEEGVALVTQTLATAPLGPYQVQAAIAAVHDEAASADDTDWPQILALYRVLDRIAPNPMATLNQAVAVAMVDGPAAGLELLDAIGDDPRLTGHHRLLSVRAHLLELAGDEAGAREAFRAAARRTTSAPERRFLEAKAARLAPDTGRDEVPG
jgi:RNA polymerase sigma factor (sigma-70 family)